jgi:hypothetical protein
MSRVALGDEYLSRILRNRVRFRRRAVMVGAVVTAGAAVFVDGRRVARTRSAAMARIRRVFRTSSVTAAARFVTTPRAGAGGVGGVRIG